VSDALQSYAVTEAVSQGRVYPEPPHPYRCDFERDRDRIMHSSAFRRLEGKTQVFSPGLDDYYRSRLTHSIEGNQMRHVQIYVDAARKVGIERIPDWTIRRTRTAKTITDRLVCDYIAGMTDRYCLKLLGAIEPVSIR
jgi:dGTP triphosphohydrolase